MAPPAFGSMPQADVAVREINEIRAAYTPTSQTYKFQVGYSLLYTSTLCTRKQPNKA